MDFDQFDLRLFEAVARLSNITAAAAAMNGKPQPTAPTELPLRRIKVRPEVFQHRSPAQYISDGHVRDLADKAKRKDLDAVTVWWDGKHWTVIDGHHRIRGYMLASRGEKPVPVEVFDGTPEQALARAAGANSKAEQSESAEVSERVVATMRSAKAKLIDKLGITPERLSEMKWHQARGEAAGSPSEWTAEEESERVEKMAKALRKALGPTADRQPDIFLQALEVYSPHLARAVREAYAAPEDELA